MINWKVRFNNPQWLLSFVSQLLIVAQIIVGGLNQAGIIDFMWSDQIDSWALGLTNAVLVVLSMLGIVQDPTTKGYTDSDRAKGYTKPK